MSDVDINGKGEGGGGGVGLGFGRVPVLNRCWTNPLRTGSSCCRGARVRKARRTRRARRSDPCALPTPGASHRRAGSRKTHRGGPKPTWRPARSTSCWVLVT